MDFTRFVRESVGIGQEGVRNFFINRYMDIQFERGTKFNTYTSLQKADGERRGVHTGHIGNSKSDGMVEGRGNTVLQGTTDSVTVDRVRSDRHDIQQDGGFQGERGGQRGRGGSLHSGVPVLKEKEHTTDLQVIYKPFSKGKSGDNQIPSSLFDSVVHALNDIQSRRGDIDTFVMNELQYGSKDQLYKALSAEQIDSVAMALDNIMSGKGMIIGDQTGVGKGRMAASIIRWANLNGMKPIFMTQQTKLFTDMYNDLADIGHTEFKHFIVTGKQIGRAHV